LLSRRDALRACLASCALGACGKVQAPTDGSGGEHAGACNPSRPAEKTPSARDVAERALPTVSANDACHPCGNPLNVTQFGAKGDGQTDDTAAFKSAISHAFAAGRNVYIPAGRYLITDTLELAHNYSPQQTSVANNVIAMTLTGDGPHSTYLLWAGRVPMTTAKKPMIFMQGFVGLRRLTLSGARQYLGAAVHTPFYGIVGNGTFWQNVLEEVDIRSVAVCFSAGTAQRYMTAGRNGLEIDPAHGGAALTVDFAQMRISRCVFRSEVAEFSDGKLDPANSLDASGKPLLNQCCALEIGQPQSVNIQFDTCSFENANEQALHTIRLSNAGDIQFRNSIFSAPPVSQHHTYAIHEDTNSGGSNIYLDHCYLMGGVALLNTTQGVLRIRNCNGENVTPDAAYKDVVDLIRVEGLGTTIDIDGLDIGRGRYTKQLTLSTAEQSNDGTTNPVGNTTATFDHRLYSLRNITGIGTVRCGHETFSPSSRNDAVLSLVPDYASAIGPRHIAISYLSDGAIDRETSAGFATPVMHGGRWMYGASLGTRNSIAWFVSVDASTCYDFSADIYVELTEGSAPVGGDVSIQVTFHDSGKRLIGQGPNSGVFLLGAASPTNGYGFIANRDTVTIYSQHIIPPTKAAYARVEFTANPPASRYVSVALGNALLGPAGAASILPVVAGPTFGAPAAPVAGDWKRGD
jgi:hypothetical protein